MGTMGTILLVLAIVAAFGGLFYLAHLQEKKRRLAIQAVAERLGWAFLPDPDPSIIPVFPRLDLFGYGHGRRMRNFVSGTLDGRRVAVFDFIYVTGSGKSRREWYQTVAYVHSPEVDAPGFVLRPENLFHKIGGLFGYQDIDVEAEPRFSEQYLLRGHDEDSIRALISPDVRDFLDGLEACAEGVGPDLFFWHDGIPVNPDALSARVEQAVRLSSLLAASSAARPPAGA